MSEKIKTEITPNKLTQDLQSYLKLAQEIGATYSKILETKDIILDYRAQYKCIVPKCVSYGTCAHCPPHAPSVESVEKLVKLYKYAILVGLKVPSSGVIKRTDGSIKPTHDLNPPYRNKIHEIVCRIEAKAFYDGYYFATGFSSGACKKLWCPDEPCQVLEGKGCRNALRARPSMEGVGMDVYKMTTQAGWDIYPIGSICQAEDMPHGLFSGIILIH